MANAECAGRHQQQLHSRRRLHTLGDGLEKVFPRRRVGSRRCHDGLVGKDVGRKVEERRRRRRRRRRRTTWRWSSFCGEGKKRSFLLLWVPHAIAEQLLPLLLYLIPRTKKKSSGLAGRQHHVPSKVPWVDSPLSCVARTAG